MVISNTFLPRHYVDIFKWVDLEDDSPTQTVRNRWLWQFGAFAKFNGIWFPCMVTQWNLQEEPLVISPVINAGSDVYTMQVSEIIQESILVEDCEYFYSVFPLGIPIRLYLQDVLPRIDRTNVIIDQAIERSLETAILIAPRRWAKNLKKALNYLRRGEWYVVDGSLIEMDKVRVLELPNTTDQLNPLWEAHDWAMQEMYIKLGFAFNPEKRERMIQAELIAQTQIIRANRSMLTNNLITQTVKYGNEKVQHIVDYFLNTEKLHKIDRVDLRFYEDSFDEFTADVNQHSVELSDDATTNEVTLEQQTEEEAQASETRQENNMV